MTGHELPTRLVKHLLSDSAEAGISTVRLYGGEPLLHPGLREMVGACVTYGMTPFVTTNGRLLDRHLDTLVDAGLRIIKLGYYGYGETYDRYVGRSGAWDHFEGVIANARGRYGHELSLHMSYVLSTHTSSLQELDRAWCFAKAYDLNFHVDLVHYSLPYFTEGPNRQLQFSSSDSECIRRFVAHLEELKRERPDLYTEPNVSIKSIPDWLLKGAAMRVPCDAYDMIWVGADGSVRLCFVTFPLGNLYEKPLKELLFTSAHKRAALGAVRLECPNCHCKRDTRIVKHLPSLLRYSYGHRAHTFAPEPVPNASFPILGQGGVRADSTVPDTSDALRQNPGNLGSSAKNLSVVSLPLPPALNERPSR
jgi:MoaA/NifB/PqqE/SkfB family radical SAM enzyme